MVSKLDVCGKPIHLALSLMSVNISDELMASVTSFMSFSINNRFTF